MNKNTKVIISLSLVAFALTACFNNLSYVPKEGSWVYYDGRRVFQVTEKGIKMCDLGKPTVFKLNDLKHINMLEVKTNKVVEGDFFTIHRNTLRDKGNCEKKAKKYLLSYIQANWDTLEASEPRSYFLNNK
jgi:hypothetical protein